MEHVLAATVEAARKSVARTPSLLPILREAGVVDSGGQGLFRLFEGALLSVQGRPVHAAGAPAARSARRGPPRGRAGVPGRRRGPRGGRVRLRDRLHPDRRCRTAPSTFRRSRRASSRSANSVLVGGDARHGQGPRPQRAAGRGDRLRPVARDADPDHGREPRHDGRRRPRGAGGGVRRRGRGAASDRGTAAGRAKAATAVAAKPAAPAARRARSAMATSGAVDERRARPGRGGGRPEPRAGDRGGRRRRGSRARVPRPRRRPHRPRRADGQPEHRRAARGSPASPAPAR